MFKDVIRKMDELIEVVVTLIVEIKGLRKDMKTLDKGE